MTSIQDCAVQRGTPSGGISLPFRCPECGPSSPRSPTALLGQHDRDAAAGLGYSDAEVDALARDGGLRAEAAR